MCLAIPGKLVGIEGRKATVQYPQEQREALMSDVSVDVGDYVMVQMGIIIKKVSEEEANVSQEAWGL